jgi:hypothetical protein
VRAGPVFPCAILLGILTAVGAAWTSGARMVRQKLFAILRDE